MLQPVPWSSQFRTFVSEQLFQLNFYRMHLLYFIFSILIFSAIFYGSNGEYHVPYTDALFLCASAMTDTGLNSINLGDVTGWQQTILCLMMLMGDLTLVSISMVLVRRHFFGKRIRELISTSKAGRDIAKDIEEGHARAAPAHTIISSLTPRRLRSRNQEPSTKSQALTADARKELQHLYLSHQRGYGGFPMPWEHHFIRDTFSRIFRGPLQHIRKTPRVKDHHYISFKPSLDSRGRFQNLTEEQEHELGGVEYRSLIVLSWMLPIYTLGWLTLVTVVMVPYSTRPSISATIKNAQPGDLDPQWWAFFVTIASYTNGGLSLLNTNMIPFTRDYLILIFSGVGVVAGNMLYPIFLRLFIWLFSKVISRNSEVHHSLSFLLHHPRRCYLFLFPKKNTWYLVGIQIGITLLAWVLFELLNIDFSPVDPEIPVGQRIMEGLYNANGLRACGMYTIDLSSLAPALQVFYMVVMYLSAFPIIMSVRQTNVYEERSLGVDNSEKWGTRARKPGGSSLLAIHFRNQLAYDLWWLILAVFLICIIERTALAIPSPGFSIFSIIFEVVSAYGTVGFSLGVPYDDYSFCGAWHKLSKLVLITVMLRGRHRILPAAIDRAVLLPGESTMLRLDKDYNGRHRTADDDEMWRREEARIREEECGAQAEAENGKQDPEEDDADVNNRNEEVAHDQDNDGGQ